MRPDSPPDPTVETLEEFCGPGRVCNTRPNPQERIQLRNQAPWSAESPPLGSLPHLVHETPDRLSLDTQYSASCRPDYESCSQADEAFYTALDFVAKELEAVPDMDDPRLLRM